jgi:galactokinase
VRMIRADGLAEPAIYSVDPGLAPIMGHWSNYPMTVARRVARNFAGDLCGADIIFKSDLPPSAGMSSSSALVIVAFLALSAANDLPARREYQANIHNVEDLAGYLGCNENGQSFGSLPGDKGVGTFGGSEDHTAILTCRNGLLNQYSYCPVKFERAIPLPADYVFAIASSGVEAEKTGLARDKYNRASLLCRADIEIWNKATGRADPHLAAAVASSSDAADKMRDILRNASHSLYAAADMLKRFEHFYAESVEIIPQAGNCLAGGDVDGFGRLVDRSQAASDTLLGNQIPETIFLARRAREIGAKAASAFGAGFGGAVWAMVARSQADEMLKAWEKSYAHAYPAAAAQAVYFITEAGPAAFELK